MTTADTQDVVTPADSRNGEAGRLCVQRLVTRRKALIKRHNKIIAELKKIKAQLKSAKLRCEPPRPHEGQRILLYGSGKFGARAFAKGDGSEGVYHEIGELGRPHIVMDCGQMISYWGGPIWKPCNAEASNGRELKQP